MRTWATGVASLLPAALRGPAVIVWVVAEGLLFVGGILAQ